MNDDKTNKRNQKLQLMLSEEELRAIDDWRFENRMPTRAAAIRELLRRGIFTNEFGQPDTASAASGDFSVLEEKPS